MVICAKALQFSLAALRSAGRPLGVARGRTGREEKRTNERARFRSFSFFAKSRARNRGKSTLRSRAKATPNVRGRGEGRGRKEKNSRSGAFAIELLLLFFFFNTQPPTDFYSTKERCTLRRVTRRSRERSKENLTFRLNISRKREDDAGGEENDAGTLVIRDHGGCVCTTSIRRSCVTVLHSSVM